MWNKNDIKFMKKALHLAQKMEGKTSPDPMVGAVIVKNGKIISHGYHEEQNTPHAEAWAIKKAAKQAKGSTLYVNLEPCCFFETKNNPPCTKAIIKAGIKKVVVAMQDPNPQVNGKGFEELKKAGIKVNKGLLTKEAKKLNEVFIKYITTGLPFVILKTAMSLDGKIATKTGESFWITGEESRKRSHKIRNTVDAIIIGIGTIIKDDPELTVRNIKNKIKNPKKIILDPLAKIDVDRKVLRIEPEKTIVIVSNNAKENKIAKIESTGAKVIRATTKNGSFEMKKIIKTLGKMGIISVLIEGGGNTNAKALSAGIVDKIYFFVAPKIIGGKEAITPIEGEGITQLLKAIKIKNLSIEKSGEDFLFSGYLC